MNRKKAIAFAVAFLSAAPALAGEGHLEIAERSLRMDPRADLEFGTIIRPSSGNGNVVMGCGNGGVATVTVPTDAINADTADDVCGQVMITPASAGQNIIITFGESDSDAAFTKDSNTLNTRFTMFDNTGVAVPGLLNFNPGGSSSADSSPVNFTTNASRQFYVGASVQIGSTTPTGEYTAIYEVTVSSN